MNLHHFKIFALLPFLYSIPASSQFGSESAPLVILDNQGSCITSEEICGDGVDQDCNGKDLNCPGQDRDRDGYIASNDCDDQNRRTYPGTAVECMVGTTPGWRTCQSGGTFSSCSTQPLCEAVGTGRCYYISSLRGSDANPGTFSLPWKTQLNISSTDQNPVPTGHRYLAAGDVVYFLSGRYGESRIYDGERSGLVVRSIFGTPTAPVTLKSYPGARATFAPSSRAAGIHIWGSRHIIIDGIEVAQSYQYGIRTSESQNVEVRNVWIHETDGVDNDNLAGFYSVESQNVSVHHSFIHDNYDRTCADTGGNKTENSRNLVFFRGGNITVTRNTIFNSVPTSSSKTGGGITYKHGSVVAGSVFEVSYNTMWNLFTPSIGSGASGTRIHHNLILNSEPPMIRDFGGYTVNSDIIVERNTIKGGFGFYYEPSETYAPIGMTQFRNNIVVNTTPENTERSVIALMPYGSDILFNKLHVGGLIAVDQNCYFNSQHSLMWGLFGAQGGGRALGSMYYNISDWQNNTGYDRNSFALDPGLQTGSFVPSAANCQNSGIWSQ